MEVSATDPGGRTSDPAAATVTVANTAPTRRARWRSSRPRLVQRRHRLGRAAAGFSDADGDAVSYTYQWFRNGTAISGATGRTLDLAEAGNGDAGDTVAVDVTALDGSGGTSATVRGSQTVGSGASHAVASYGFEEAAGTAIVDESGGSDGGARRRDAHATLGRFGRALCFDGEDDMATVPDSAPLDLATGMTLEAWVRPQRRHRLAHRDLQGVGAAGWTTRSTRAATPTSRASNLGGDPGARGTGDLDPDKWSHLAATYDGDDPAAVRERHPGRHAHAARGARRRLRRPADASAPTTSGASTSTASSTRSASTTGR